MDLNYDICVLNSWRNIIGLSVVHFANDVPEIFPRPSLGKSWNNVTYFETSNWAYVISNQLYSLFRYSFSWVILQMLSLNCNEPDWYFPFDLIVNTHNNSFGNFRMFHEDFLHLACGQSMSSSINYIVLPRHYVEISVLIIISWISSIVVTW